MIFLAKVIKKTVLELEINYTLPCLPPKTEMYKFSNIHFLLKAVYKGHYVISDCYVTIQKG